MDAQGWSLSSTGCSSLTHKDRATPLLWTEVHGRVIVSLACSLRTWGGGFFTHSHPQVLILGCFYVTHTGVLGKAMSPGWKGS